MNLRYISLDLFFQSSPLFSLIYGNKFCYRKGASLWYILSAVSVGDIGELCE